MAAEVLIVEDDAAIRELLHFTLSQAGFRVTLAVSAEDALAMVASRRPAVALVDWMLPGMSGVALVRELRRQRRTGELPVIMVTARGGEESRITGLEQGADDYIEKPFSPREVVARLRALIRRRAPQHIDTAFSVGPFDVDPPAHRVSFDGRPLDLRQAEYRLLRYLLSRPGLVMTREQLLDGVWGEHVAIEERTVDVHVRRLRMALGEAGRHVLVTVRGGGYMLDLRATEPTADAAPTRAPVIAHDADLLG